MSDTTIKRPTGIDIDRVRKGMTVTVNGSECTLSWSAAMASTARRTLHLITYGCGNAFDKAKFEPISNKDWIKPAGGLWSSPVGAAYGWREWCTVESFGDLTTHFTFWFTGNILTIDSVEDALAMPWRSREFFSGHAHEYPDFEAMAKAGIDAIHLTEAGERATRYGPMFERGCLYGWDCECVLILNPAGITVEG